MVMPNLRPSVKRDLSKNKSFQDILSPTAKALEVLSVEALDYHVHNTKAVVLVEENGVQEERVVLYNRIPLDLDSVLIDVPSNDLQWAIDYLNENGWSVSEDDIGVDGDFYRVLPTSLGYVGALGNAVWPREISCDGATTDAVLMLIVHESITQDEFIAAMFSLRVEINGQVYGPSDETTEFLDRHVRSDSYRENLTPDQFALVTEGWTLLDASRLSNIASDPLRIKYGFLETSVEKIKLIVLETVNPTSYIDEETGAAAFCLAPQELVCKPELCYAINIDNWTGADEQYQIIYDAIDHIRNTFEAEDPNANSVYVSYGDEYDENNFVLTVYIRIRFEHNYTNNPPPNGLGGSFKVKFQLPAVNSYSNWYEYDVGYGDDGSEYTFVSNLGTASYARDINACLIQVITRPAT